LIKAEGKIISKRLSRTQNPRNEATLVVGLHLQNGIPLPKANVENFVIKVN